MIGIALGVTCCVALFAVLYAASHDERDNMKGACRAAAIRAMNE